MCETLACGLFVHSASYGTRRDGNIQDQAAEKGIGVSCSLSQLYRIVNKMAGHCARMFDY